jgi:prolyl-tRNA synthetase
MQLGLLHYAHEPQEFSGEWWPAMRRSQLLCVTLREDPTEAEVPSHRLLVRGAYVRQLAAGIYTLLPLGMRVRKKIFQILREEMDAVQGQEVIMPVVHPAELWQVTGRWYTIGQDMVRLKDRGEHDLVLAMTHEEVIAELLRQYVSSYRQLPVVLYQIHTKFRDEPRPRGGMIRLREFTMKDAYSAHATQADLDRYYPQMYQAYFNVFRRCGLDVLAVESDVGMMGGTMAHEFMVVTPIGEDVLVLCDSCGFRANRQIARFRKDPLPSEPPQPIVEVATPHTTTIEDLAKFLDIPAAKTAKATFFMSDHGLIFAVVRGDMEVNETKLANVTTSRELRPATAEELRAAGIVAGYASPIGVQGVQVVIDDLIPQSANLVAGANKEGYHLRNVNYGRDYTADIVADIANAYEGAPCANCGAPLRLARAIEVGNIFKLGTKYTEALKAYYKDEKGQEHPLILASYGIGVERLIATIIEVHHDEFGIIWPVTVAPYHVYMVLLNHENAAVREKAEELYQALGRAGVEVLLDDRAESPGVKFMDADLLGMPLRLTLSRRTLDKQSVELKLRGQKDMRLVPLDQAVAEVQKTLDSLRQTIQATVVPEPFLGQQAATSP